MSFVRSAGSVDDAVSNGRCGGDDRGFTELAAKTADRDGDGVGERVGVLVPDLFEEFFRAEEGGAGAEEGFEEAEFLDRQVDVPAVTGDRAACRVEFDPGCSEGAGSGRRP